MSVKIEKIEKNKMKLEFTVDDSVFNAAIEGSYRKNMKKFSVPGFRKGRVPKSIVIRYYGPEVFYEDALELICPEQYQKAIEENGIHTVSSPEFDAVQLEDGKPFVFTATVDVAPEFELGEYKGVSAPYVENAVTGDDIDEYLKREAEKNARLVSIDTRPAQDGDLLSIDYEGFVDGVAFEGGKAAGSALELGNSNFIAGFAEQLVGKSTGEDVEVRVTFPEDYHANELSGKDAVFAVKINAIKEKEIPAVDDDFAQDVSEFDTLDEYREDIRKRLTDEAAKRAKDEFGNAIIKKIADSTEIDMPESMTDNQFARDIKDFEMSLAYRGITLEQYFEVASTSREELEETMKKRAVEECRTLLVMEKIAELEGILVSDEDLDAELLKRAETYGKSLEEYKFQMAPEHMKYVRDAMRADKIVDFLIENAVRE